jgi:DNA ligase-1
MLAKPTKAIGEVLDRFEGRQFTCEYKYDGERAQVHMLEDGSVSVFSRNSEDMKAKYPDLVEQLPRVGDDLYRLSHTDGADGKTVHHGEDKVIRA